MLADAGAALIDADAIARSVTAAGGAAITSIVEIFGPDYIDETGALDRGRMRALIFSSPNAKCRLEAAVHPFVLAAMQAQERAALDAGHLWLVFDIPLLVESERWQPKLGHVVVVDCSRETQIARVIARDTLARETVEAILAAQATPAQRRSAADIVLWNDGISLDGLRNEVRQITAYFGL